MDKGKGGGHGDHSHRKKVTPAVADDAFLAEEDEEYDELYGNIDIGPGFLQPLPMNKAPGVKNKEVESKKPPLPPPSPPRLRPFQNAGGVSLPGTSGNGQKQPFVRRGSTLFYLGGLHWWTTDADVEYELCKYGKVREVRFFAERASGKSKGYCKVEFCDSLAAAACKEGLVGHEFNDRPCVVSSSQTPFLATNQPDVANEGKKEPGEVEATKPVDGVKEGGDGGNQGKKGPDEVEATKPGDGNIGGRGDVKEGGDGDKRGYERGNWGRGDNLGMGNRGHGNPVRNWGGGMGGRSVGMGGAAPRMLMHPRMAAHAGFPEGPTHPFPGNLPSDPGVGLRGLAPYGNYSFNGKGMPMNGIGMIPPPGKGGPNKGMRPVPDMGISGGDEHDGGKVAGESYREEVASDHQYDEVDRNRGDSPNATREKDRGSERNLPGTSDRPVKDDKVPEFDRYVPSENDSEHGHEENDREIIHARSRDSDIDRERSRSRDHVPNRERGWNPDRLREDMDRYADHHRFADHAPQHNDEQERGRSSRPSIKSRLSYPTKKYSHNGKRR